MEVEYKNRELQKCAEMPGYAQRRLGAEQAKLFLLRLCVIREAESFEDLRYTPGHFHELHNVRKGQWAFNLNGPYRLILTPKVRPIPVNSYGGFDWSKIQSTIIVEIVNYHKERGL